MYLWTSKSNDTRNHSFLQFLHLPQDSSTTSVTMGLGGSDVMSETSGDVSATSGIASYVVLRVLFNMLR